MVPDQDSTCPRIKNHSNSRREGVNIYYKQSVALKILYIKYLEESIFSHVLTPNEPCNFISLYWSPSQPTDDIFDQFADNLELCLDEAANKNPFPIAILASLNVKSEN